MLDLKKDTILKWNSLLPEDIKSSLGYVDDFPDETAEEFVKMFNSISDIEWLDFLRNNIEILQKSGRHRRIRLLSHISQKTYPFSVQLFHNIVTDEGKDEGDGTGKSTLKEMFLEDIIALNEALANRVAKNSLDSMAMEALKAAAYEVEPIMGVTG